MIMVIATDPTYNTGILSMAQAEFEMLQLAFYSCESDHLNSDTLVVAFTRQLLPKG